ncbi:uncharacterized protein LOC130205328 isoform X2 [Pseudoliparis swirei]|nr:uncharacterized protein LOC130205328 isoform X2 [Pseudoliparis swirei]
MTFKKLQLRNNHNIRLQDSTEGELGEYCWSTELQCTIGESFQRAYVVLPVDITTVAHEQLEVRATDQTAATLLLAHDNPTTVADTCGLRYDVTPRFTTERAGTSFCIQVVAQDDVLGDRVLRCPPFLVTFWQRRNQDLANQEEE